jgi:hypothetical protein
MSSKFLLSFGRRLFIPKYRMKANFAWMADATGTDDHDVFGCPVQMGSDPSHWE